MSETCAVCKKGKGPTKCEICGFSDNGFINRSFPIPEDTKNWLETVVKPYRAQWEARKQNNDLLAQLEAAKQREAELQAQLEAAKKSAPLPASMPPAQLRQRQPIQQTQPAPSITSAHRREWNSYSILGLLGIIAMIVIIIVFFVFIFSSPNDKKHFSNGNINYNRKDYDKAIEDYTAAINIKPDNAVYLNSRGYTYYSKKDYDKAIADFEAALRLDPNYNQAKQYIANIKQIQDKLKWNEQNANVNQQSSNFAQEREDKSQRARGVVKLVAKQPAKEVATAQPKPTVAKSSSSTIKSIEEQDFAKETMKQSATTYKISVAVFPSDDIGASLSNSEKDVVTDKVREVALKVLPFDKFVLLTQNAVINRLGGAENYIKECKENSNILDLGKKAMVEYVAQARVAKSGNKMRLTVELYNVSTESLVGVFNGESDNIHDLINLIDKNVPNAVFKKIPGAQK